MWLTYKRKQHQHAVIQNNPNWTDTSYDQNITIHCNSSILHEGKLPSMTFRRGWVTWEENKVSLNMVSKPQTTLAWAADLKTYQRIFSLWLFSKHCIIQATFSRMPLYYRDVLVLELFSAGLAEDTVPELIVYSFPLVPIMCFLLWGQPIFGCVSLCISIEVAWLYLPAYCSQLSFPANI